LELKPKNNFNQRIFKKFNGVDFNMTNFERQSEVIPDETIEDGDSLREEAIELCEDINEAAGNMSLALRFLKFADNNSTRVAKQTSSEKLPFLLKVSIGEEVEASTSRGDEDMVEFYADEFMATEFRGVSHYGAQFYNSTSLTLLHIKGHNYDVQPFFPNMHQDY
jgi:hypothetical protein